MTPENASKLWKMIQEAGDYLQDTWQNRNKHGLENNFYPAPLLLLHSGQLALPFDTNVFPPFECGSM